jgi:hypothetical protein
VVSRFFAAVVFSVFVFLGTSLPSLAGKPSEERAKEELTQYATQYKEYNSNFFEILPEAAKKVWICHCMSASETGVSLNGFFKIRFEEMFPHLYKAVLFETENSEFLMNEKNATFHYPIRPKKGGFKHFGVRFFFKTASDNTLAVQFGIVGPANRLLDLKADFDPRYSIIGYSFCIPTSDRLKSIVRKQNAGKMIFEKTVLAKDAVDSDDEFAAMEEEKKYLETKRIEQERDDQIQAWRREQQLKQMEQDRVERERFEKERLEQERIERNKPSPKKMSKKEEKKPAKSVRIDPGAHGS